MAEYDEQEKNEAVEEVDVQSTVAGLIEAAIAFVDEELSPERAKATSYYLGRPFGNEETGRSQVVLTEVRDAVDGTIPSLLRVFHGPDHAVEFEPVGPEDVEHAKQATDYARYVFERDNNGLLITYATLKDGLVRKVGAVKWGWEPAPAEAFTLENVDEEQYQAMLADENVEITQVTKVKDLYTVEGTRQDVDGRIWIAALPPEELIFGSEERAVDGAIFIGHRTEKTRSELLEMGYDAELIDLHGQTDNRLADNEEALERRSALTNGDSYANDVDGGEANEKILYVEGYGRVDVDGDGKAELRKFCTVGPGYFIVNGEGRGEPVSYVPIAAWTPNPEPHTIAGLSQADATMDMQLIKSSLFRSALDSLALSIYPRTAYQEGMVSVEDVLNTEIGAPIRTHAAPANVLQEFKHTWVGKEALGALEYCDSIVEKRIGRDQGAMGLDADALQSSTSTAVGAAVQASQERVEVMARLYAEMLLKPLFKGILRELVAHQPRAKMIRLRNTWVQIDPSRWDVSMDVIVRVALGSSLKEEKLATLAAVKATQESILQTLGPQNPIVHLSQYRHTLATALELNGYKDVHNFFKEVDPNWEPAPAPPQPTPEMLLAEIENKKLQLESMKAQAAVEQKERELEMKLMEIELKAKLEREKMEQQFIIEQAKIEAEMQLKLKELELKHNTEITTTAIEAEIEQAKEQARIQAENIREEARLQLEETKHARELEIEREKAEREAQMKAAEREQKQAEKKSEQETRKAEASKPVTVNITMPKTTRKRKINRDKDGRVESVEETD
jgi:hypothetical protein